jgi:hypothetical protein
VVTRLATAAIVVCLCVFAASRGSAILAFAVALQEKSEGRGNEIDAWFSTPPVAAMALDAALDNMAGAKGVATAQRRDDVLTELLSRRPLSSMAWLSLAEGRQSSGVSQGAVLAALKMSALTGPNEAQVMWRRGIFCLLQWEALTPDFQRQMARDLAGPINDGLLDDRGVEQIEDVLRQKSPETRARIAALLQTEGLDAKALAKIGLDTAGTTP